MEHFENFTIRKPGSWFHGWTIPNFPWTFSENPNKDLAVTFETFRTILSDLNEGARVNGNIEKHKAEELYYHFLLHYFPDSKQIPVLRRRHSNPNALDAEADLMINDEGSLVWPPLPLPPHRRTASDDSLQTVIKTSETPVSDMQDSDSDIPSLIASLLAATDSDDGVEKQIMDNKDILKAQSKEIYDFDTGKDDYNSIPARNKSMFDEYDRSRLKRGFSSDDNPTRIDYYELDHLRKSKRFKSNSDHHSAYEEPVEEGMMDLSSSMRNSTDRTMEIPTHDEIEYSLVEANLKMLSDGVDPSTKLSIFVRNRRNERIPTWLKLAEAVNNARNTLHGDDLELFERLISVSRPQHEVEELIQKWGNGSLKNFKQLREEASGNYSWRERAEKMDESY